MRLPFAVYRQVAGATVLALLAVLASPVRAQTPATRTSVVVDSNPALFAVLAALNAAGYDAGLQPADTIRKQVRTRLAGQNVPALKDLKQFVAAHRRADPNQDLAQYVTLALFLGNPPGLALSVPVAGLPPDAEAVADILPILRNYWQQVGLDQIWQDEQPGIDYGLTQDKAIARAMLQQVNSYFRIPQDYTNRQFYIFPNALLSSSQSDALNYEDNYYIAVGLDLKPQLQQVRHTYLHFLLDPLIDHYPAAFTPVEHGILPLVANAPALDAQFKRDPELLYTECLVRAVEIQLDPGTPAEKQAKVAAAMSQGLVMTSRWYEQLTAYQNDPANFNEFYPEAAFALRLDELPGEIKHIQYAAAPSAAMAEPRDVQPQRALGLIEQANAKFDMRDWATATTLAQAALKQPRADRAQAYYLLGKLAAVQNQPQAAVTNFGQALAVATATDTHVRTWSNIYLARLYDANHDRAHAVIYYQAALVTADTPGSKALAQAGIKAPYEPPGAGKH